MEKVPKKKCFYEEPEQVCQPKYGKECKDIPDKKCKITYDEKCVDVPEEVCKPVSQKKCSKKPVQVFTNSIKFLLNFTSFFPCGFQQCKMQHVEKCTPKKKCHKRYEMTCKKTPSNNYA